MRYVSCQLVFSIAELAVYLTTFCKAKSDVLLKLFEKPTSSASQHS